MSETETDGELNGNDSVDNNEQTIELQTETMVLNEVMLTWLVRKYQHAIYWYTSSKEGVFWW